MATEYKTWTTFQSDYGYEVRHPDCWKVGINSPDEEGEFSQIKSIDIEEGEKCKTPQRDRYVSNGVGIQVLWDIYKNEKDREVEIEGQERVLGARLKNKHLAYYKKFKIGAADVIQYVEYLDTVKKDKIRWMMEIYCDSRFINIGGPSIQNPDPSYFEKFKKDDFGLPDPEKTIYQSFHCIDPKIKSKKK